MSISTKERHLSLALANRKRQSSPPLPHERDESTETAVDPPREPIRRAQKDLQSGQEDTDLRSTGGVRVSRSPPRKRG